MYLCCSRQIRRRCLCDRQMRKRNDSTRQAANQSISFQKRKSFSWHKVLQTRRGQEIQGDCYVYIILEYVIGCSIDLLYTGLNFAPYFQKECTYVIVASSSYMSYNLPIIRNFGLVITIHVMICQKLLDACKCLECFIHVYIL